MIKIDEKNITRKKSITVEFFYNNAKDKFNVHLLSNKVGFDRIITDQNLHRPGLALAGFVELFSFNRIQIFGNTEMYYLKKLERTERREKLKKIFEFELPCIFITDGNKPFDEMVELSDEFNIPIFGSSDSTTKISYLITDLLDDQFSPRLSIHGSFVDVYGVGLLFAGKSGVGKSEVALDLVERGHRLVADDVVIFTKKGEGILMGSGTDLVKHFMEIRGIGILDVRSMFGIRAIRFQKRLEVIIELEIWDTEAEYTRTGLEENTVNVMGVDILHIKLPIVPGKNLTVISEVIALNYLLKHYGYDAAKILQEKLIKKMKRKDRDINRVIDYFEHDFE